MKKVIYWIFFTLCILMATSFVKIITLESWVDDCMLDYVMSHEKWWYIYKIDTNKYHIDTQNYQGLEQIWVSRWCLMLPYNKWYSFMAVSNSIYCSVVSLIM